jgi:hypothetical protein
MGFKDVFSEIRAFLMLIVEVELGGNILKVTWKQKGAKWK